MSKAEAKKKLRFASFSLACCEGCQLQLTYLNERLLGLLDHIEIVRFREIASEITDEYDIAFVEGSITRGHDEDRVKEIRENAKILVAYGACAAIGGINGLRKNWYNSFNASFLDSLSDSSVFRISSDRSEFLKTLYL